MNMDFVCAPILQVSEYYDEHANDDEDYQRSRKSVRVLNHFAKEEVNLYLSDQGDLSKY